MVAHYSEPRLLEFGVPHDSVLTEFGAQVDSVVGVCYGLSKSLKRFLYLLPEQHQKMVLNALIKSHLDYANVLFWGLPAP